MPSSGPKLLPGMSQIELACSFRMRIERMMLTFGTLADYMEAAAQIVPEHATITFDDLGDSVSYTFVWAEQREPTYHVETQPIKGAVEPRRDAVESPEKPDGGEKPEGMPAGAGAAPRKR